MKEKSKCLIAILAGGKSSRMQKDKSEILWAGESLLARTAGVASQACPNVIIAGRNRPKNWSVAGCEFIADEPPDSGPLGGLIAALHRTPGSSVLLLAVDMPLLTVSAVRWLFNQSTGTDGDGIAVYNDGQLEPLLSIYNSNAASIAEELMRVGRRSLKGVIERGRFSNVELPAEYKLAVSNVNTPEELEKLTKLNQEA